MYNYNKYIKYKKKYLELKGGNDKINNEIENITNQIYNNYTEIINDIKNENVNIFLTNIKKLIMLYVKIIKDNGTIRKIFKIIDQNYFS